MDLEINCRFIRVAVGREGLVVNLQDFAKKELDRREVYDAIDQDEFLDYKTIQPKEDKS